MADDDEADDDAGKDDEAAEVSPPHDSAKLDEFDDAGDERGEGGSSTIGGNVPGLSSEMGREKDW